MIAHLDRVRSFGLHPGYLFFFFFCNVSLPVNQLDRAGLWAKTKLTAPTTGSPRSNGHARGFVSIERHPRGNQGSMDDQLPNSAYHSSTVSQSDRAGRTRRAIRTLSYLKRPSFPSMKPTVARRFSHWHNVPTLQGPHSQPSPVISEPQVPPQELFMLLCAVVSPDVPSLSAHLQARCRSLTNRAGGRFCGTAQDNHPVPTVTQPRL